LGRDKAILWRGNANLYTIKVEFGGFINRLLIRDLYPKSDLRFCKLERKCHRFKGQLWDREGHRGYI